MNLDGKQVQQLHHALVSAFKQSDLAMMVRVELQEDIEAITGGENKSEIAYNLILWAERRTRVYDLVRGAHAHNQNNPAIRDLYIECMAKSTTLKRAIPLDELKQICLLMVDASLEVEDLREIFYSDFYNEAIMQDLEQTPSILAMLDTLSCVGPQKKTHLPIADFARRAADRVLDVDLKSRLIGVSCKLEEPFNFRTQVGKAVVERIEHPYLVVELSPVNEGRDKNEDRRYRMEYSLFWEYQDECVEAPDTPENRVPIEHWSIEGPITLQEAREEFRRVLNTDRIKYLDELSLEFLLPHSLLFEPIEHWEWDGPIGTESCGTNFLITVRLWDRVIQTFQAPLGNLLLKRWNDRWAQFQFHSQLQITEQSEELSIHFDWPEPNGEFEVLCNQLRVFSKAVPMGVNATAFDTNLLRAFICEGIPVAVCLRPQADDMNMRDLVEEHGRINEEMIRFSELRDWFRVMRRKHVAGFVPAGEHLVLLWDNPRRVPVKYTRTFQ